VDGREPPCNSSFPGSQVPELTHLGSFYVHNDTLLLANTNCGEIWRTIMRETSPMLLYSA
jgi:hypothetical protein